MHRRAWAAARPAPARTRSDDSTAATVAFTPRQRHMLPLANPVAPLAHTPSTRPDVLDTGHEGRAEAARLARHARAAGSRSLRGARRVSGGDDGRAAPRLPQARARASPRSRRARERAAVRADRGGVSHVVGPDRPHRVRRPPVRTHGQIPADHRRSPRRRAGAGASGETTGPRRGGGPSSICCRASPARWRRWSPPASRRSIATESWSCACRRQRPRRAARPS